MGPGTVTMPRTWREVRRGGAGTNSAQPHRHDDADKTLEGLEDTRAHLVLQFKEDLVLGERTERVHDKLRVEGDLEIRAAVGNRHRLVGLAEIGRGGGDL